MTLDQDKLVAVLKDNPEAVARLIFGENGVAGKLDSYICDLTRYGEGLFDSRNKGIEERIKDLGRRTDDLKRLLDKKEQTLRDQFLAAERLIGQMNSQSQWLEQQMSALSNWQTVNYRRKI